MKVAALDLGSNTFLCLICELEGLQVTKVYSDEAKVVRLGQGLSQSKKFHPEALQRAKEALIDFKKQIDAQQPEKILAMATAAARDAENKHELFKICEDLSIPLQIISGEEESKITYLGSISGLSDESQRLVIDIGGRSTEFILGKGLNYISGHSHNIGCVKLTEKYISKYPVDLSEVQKCLNEIQTYLVETKKRISQPIDQILAVAGTPTALAAAELGRFDAGLIDGYHLTKFSLENWKNKITRASVQEIEKMGIPEGRADVILVGVLILLETLKVFDKKSVVVSTRGVRYGVALQLG